jgi:hypothetical protein
MKEIQEFTFRDLYLSDKKEQRINRKQFFNRIFFLLFVLFISIFLYYLCFAIDFLMHVCPILRIVGLA